MQCLYGAVSKALVLLSETCRFDSRPRLNIFTFSINVLFLKKIDLFEKKTKNWTEIEKNWKKNKKMKKMEKIENIRKNWKKLEKHEKIEKIEPKTQKKFGVDPLSAAGARSPGSFYYIENFRYKAEFLTNRFYKALRDHPPTGIKPIFLDLIFS
jgi:hypothetical protein